MDRIIKDGLHYPIEAFRSFHPNVAFSGNRPSRETLEAHGWQILQSDPVPEQAGKIAQRGPVEYREGVPYWTWVLRDMTAAEVEQARAEAHTDFLAFLDHLHGQFLDGYPRAEPLAWAKKEAAAEAYDDGVATQRQITSLQNEADAKGETIDALVASILAKSGPFNAIIEYTSGLRSRTQAQIDAADPADLQGILDAAKAGALAKAQEITGG